MTIDDAAECVVQKTSSSYKECYQHYLSTECHTILGMMYLSQQNPKIKQRFNPLFGLEPAIELMIDKLSLKNNRRVLVKRRSISGERRTATILFYISNLSEIRFR